MAGHSQFKNIMHRKGAQDAKRSKAFTKLIREITVAAREGGDAAANPRLRAALAAARAANMPKDNVERAIKKGVGGDDAETYMEIRYEGYGSGGVALIVDALTDNRNRAASEVRAAFNKFGGSLGETNSVTFMFDRVGMISYPPEIAGPDEMFEAALEAGASNVDSHESGHEVTCAVDDFARVREALEERFGDGSEARLTWVPKSTIPVDEDQAASVMRLIETLEDSDDVQHVSANFEVTDDVLARLTA